MLRFAHDLLKSQTRKGLGYFFSRMTWIELAESEDFDIGPNMTPLYEPQRACMLSDGIRCSFWERAPESFIVWK
jgi:hypothetical protein